MITYKLIVAYDGTHYSGWQIQKNSISIQATIEKVLSKIFKEPITITGAGRTDAGVHAVGQVAHFKAIKKNYKNLHKSINALLPPAIKVVSIETADPLFHARYSAIGKEYHYYIHTGSSGDPFTYPYSYHCKAPLDLVQLQKGAQQFIGTHDFSSFANGAPLKLATKNLIRTISKLEVLQNGNKISLKFEGDGFLHKMVRNITGTLLEVAKGKISCDDIIPIFAFKNRSKTPAPAPPQGLFLMKVFYPGEIQSL
jgi:tRNA pseudouridine38-40 synthase